MSFPSLLMLYNRDFVLVTLHKKNKREGNDNASATVDLEEKDGNKGTLPGRPRGHKRSQRAISNVMPLPLR
jgi:hypothetical protein